MCLPLVFEVSSHSLSHDAKLLKVIISPVSACEMSSRVGWLRDIAPGSAASRSITVNIRQRENKTEKYFMPVRWL